MAAPKPGDWMESLQNVADLGHFAAGYGVAVSCFPTHTWWRILIVEIVFLTLVGWKEFVYDLKNETGETVGSCTWTTTSDPCESGTSVGWLRFRCA
jgi:hypothetical protein